MVLEYNDSIIANEDLVVLHLLLERLTEVIGAQLKGFDLMMIMMIMMMMIMMMMIMMMMMMMIMMMMVVWWWFVAKK